jgi:hypothetical protein
VLEKRIESVLRISPELIDSRFKGRTVETQQRRGNSRLDLMIRMPRGVIIVEIKNGVLSPADVLQVFQYCRSWALHHELRVLHETFLVGYSPIDEKPLHEKIRGSVFRLRLRFLGKDVPSLVQEKIEGGYERWDESSGRRPIRIAH